MAHAALYQEAYESEMEGQMVYTRRVRVYA